MRRVSLITRTRDRSEEWGEARNHNDLDSQPADRRNVVVDVWVLGKEAPPIAEDVGAANKINDEEDRSRDSPGGKSYGIDLCQHVLPLSLTTAPFI